jgi:hypothetical protein
MIPTVQVKEEKRAREGETNRVRKREEERVRDPWETEEGEGESLGAKPERCHGKNARPDGPIQSC